MYVVIAAQSAWVRELEMSKLQDKIIAVVHPKGRAAKIHS